MKFEAPLQMDRKKLAEIMRSKSNALFSLRSNTLACQLEMMGLMEPNAVSGHTVTTENIIALKNEFKIISELFFKCTPVMLAVCTEIKRAIVHRHDQYFAKGKTFGPADFGGCYTESIRGEVRPEFSDIFVYKKIDDYLRIGITKHSYTGGLSLELHIRKGAVPREFRSQYFELYPNLFSAQNGWQRVIRISCPGKKLDEHNLPRTSNAERARVRAQILMSDFLMMDHVSKLRNGVRVMAEREDELSPCEYVPFGNSSKNREINNDTFKDNINDIDAMVFLLNISGYDNLQILENMTQFLPSVHKIGDSIKNISSEESVPMSMNLNLMCLDELRDYISTVIGNYHEID